MKALVTGAGPIGMLAALIGVQHGLEVHVLDRVTEGAKPQLVHDAAATYHSGAIADIGFEPDVIIECAGVGSVIIDSIRNVGAGGWSASRVSAAAGSRADSHRPTWPRIWSWPTTWSSARSTPTAGTLPGGRMARHRRPGLLGQRSRAACRHRTSPMRSSAAPTTLKVVVEFGG